MTTFFNVQEDTFIYFLFKLKFNIMITRHNLEDFASEQDEHLVDSFADHLITELASILRKLLKKSKMSELEMHVHCSFDIFLDCSLMSRQNYVTFKSRK